MTAPLFALTLYPEWAWAIHAGSRFGGEPDGTVYRPGHLRPVVETARLAGWSTAHVDGARGGRRVGGPGLVWGDQVVALPPVGPSPATRAIVAVAQVAEITWGSDSPWAVAGQYQWRLHSVQSIAPVPCHQGRQGLWRVEGEMLEAVRVAYRAARSAA